MNNIFEVIRSDNFFSILCSKNKEIYILALFVVKKCHQQHLRMDRTELANMLISNLEDKMLYLEAEDGDEAFDTSNLRGYANFLIRKLLQTKWLEKEYGDGFQEFIIVPDYSIRIIDVLFEIAENKPREYDRYAFLTYSVLNTAKLEKESYYRALSEAHKYTFALKASLHSLHDNIGRYHQTIQQQTEISRILEEHFIKYKEIIINKIFDPLKTTDSVHRYKERIIVILKSWQENRRILNILGQEYLQAHPNADPQDSLSEVVALMRDVINCYEEIILLLKEIDKKNTLFTRTSMERAHYILNTDKDIKGKLIDILRSLPSLDAPDFPEEIAELPVYEQGFVDNESLYKERKRRERDMTPPQPVKAKSANAQDSKAAMLKKLEDALTRDKVYKYILGFFAEHNLLPISKINIEEDQDFLKVVLSVINADYKDVPYTLEYKNGKILVNGYLVPEIDFRKRGDQRDVAK